jgi:hypothetical protein
MTNAPSPAAVAVLRGMSPAQRNTLLELVDSGTRGWFRAARTTRQALTMCGLVEREFAAVTALGREVAEAERARRLLASLKFEAARFPKGEVPATVLTKMAELKARAGK